MSMDSRRETPGIGLARLFLGFCQRRSCCCRNRIMKLLADILINSLRLTNTSLLCFESSHSNFLLLLNFYHFLHKLFFHLQLQLSYNLVYDWPTFFTYLLDLAFKPLSNSCGNHILLVVEKNVQFFEACLILSLAFTVLCIINRFCSFLGSRN